MRVISRNMHVKENSFGAMFLDLIFLLLITIKNVIQLDRRIIVIESWS